MYTKGAQVLNLYIFVYIHSYIYTHTHICIHIYVYIYVCMYVCMYVHIYVQTHISLYIYVHIHLHIRIYMNICNICNNHEYTMHPTSPEASNPFNSETPTPDLHRTSYKLDIHTLSYIYTILCVYIYTYILEPYKILGRLELPGLGREVEGGILGAPRGLHALKRRTDGRVCVCGCLYIHVRHIYRSTMCLCRRRKRKMRRGRHRYCTQCPG